MAEPASDNVLLFDRFRLDRRTGGLFRIDQTGNTIPVALGSRALELLDLLARRKGESVSKDEIMTVVWSGRAVEEANLNVQISKLRHILDQDRPNGSCIQTITGYGYRFIANVTSVDRAALSAGCTAAEYASGEPKERQEPGILSEPGPSEIEDEFGAKHADKVVRLALSGWQPHHAEGECPSGRVLPNVEDGSFLIDKLDAAGVIDHELTAVLLDLRRRLIDDYGNGAAAAMLIDEVIAAYQDFIRLTGWVANLSIVIEDELFGVEGCRARLQSPSCLSESLTRGTMAEQHLARLCESLIPLAERRGCVMREALAALETFRAAPSQNASVPLGRLPPSGSVKRP